MLCVQQCGLPCAHLKSTGLLAAAAVGTAVRPACCEASREPCSTSDAFAKLLAYFVHSIKKEADTLKVLQRNTLKELVLTGSTEKQALHVKETLNVSSTIRYI